MVAAIIFAQVWGVVQLAVLASAARTVRLRTVFAAMAAGFYLVGPLTAFIQLSWIRLAAPFLGLSPFDLSGVASYTIDPFMEEAAKLLPLACLMLIPAIRRQWSVTDCVLVAAATGSGFGLTEDLFRYAAWPHAAETVAGGWVIPFNRFSLFVPGFVHTLTSWITSGAYFDSNPVNVNWHLAWSAIGGLAVGLVVRRGDRRALIGAALLFLLVALDHAAGNAIHVRDHWLSFASVPFHYLSVCLGLLVLVTLGFAWWLDRPAQRAGLASGPLLAAESAARSPAIGTFTAALSRLPWSVGWVYGFDRERRALHAAEAASAGGIDTHREALVAKRDRLEQRLRETAAPAWRPAWLTPEAIRRELRRPPVILWLVLLAPSVLFLIVGGFPQTAWLQRVLTSRLVWPLFLLITLVGQGRIAWRVFKGLRGLPATVRLPLGDEAAALGLQLACSVGAVFIGGFTITRVLGGVGASERLLTLHASDAVSSATPAGAAAAAGSAGAAHPPRPDLSAEHGSAGNEDSSPDRPGPDQSLEHGRPSDEAPVPQPTRSTPHDRTTPPARHSPQDLADAAAAAASKADAAAAAAAAAKTQAYRDADSASIKQATADPGSDPDIADLRSRTRAAHDAADAASQKASEPDDPWNPATHGAETQAKQAAKDAEDAQQAAEQEFQHRLDAQDAAAKQAAKDADNAADAASANAAAAKQAAADAQNAADAAVAKAASDAARAANPAQAAADDAARDYEAAKARENAAFYGSDDQAHHDARVALDAARARAEAAQAAADAGKSKSSGGPTWPPKKP